MTATRVHPSDEALAILPAGTKPPAWVTDVDVESQAPDAVLWSQRVEGRDPSWRVEQRVTEADGQLTLSQPYITTHEDWFDWTVEDARAAAATLYIAARLLITATEQTWALVADAN